MLGTHLLENLDTLRHWARRRRTGLLRAAAAVLAIVAVPAALLYLAPYVLVWTAPTLDLSKDLYTANRPVAFTFLDAQDQIVGHRGAVVGDRLTLGEMPPYLPAAFIAMEDRSFYENEGIDVRGLVRATLVNLRAGHVVAGGSTITQQTAKIIFLNPRRTFSRKIEELLDAAALQKSLNKKQILELYLNRIYLGSGAYGVDGAAHVYFGKSARDLTLAEAAMLATLTRAPSAFSPRRDLEAAQMRADHVLRAMIETGAITQAQADDARARPAVISDRTIADARNFYMDTAAEEALRLIASDGTPHSSDLVVHTTLEPKIEEGARHALAHTLDAHGRREHASEGAVVVMKPDGAVSALIGGRDYDASVFNRATQAKRQPGSAFKPFVYLAALENGISPWDTRSDGPVDIDGWTPTNYGGRSYGTVTLATALARSINTVTAGLAQEVGITSVVDAAHRCGITSPLAANASLALGTSEVTPLELTAAYATFASGGLKAAPYFVREVDDSTGQVLYRRKQTTPERVIASHVDRDLTAMLYGVVEEGTGRSAALSGHQAAGKTGTTQDYHDAWFVGFTTDYVAGVWIGNDDSSPMRGVTGGSLPASVWKSVMVVAEHGLPAKSLDKSSQPPPEEETDTAESTSSDDGTNPSSTDESGTSQSDDESSVQSEEGQPPPPARRADRTTFWNWLFGNRGNSGQPPSEPPPGAAPPPPPPPPPANGDNGQPPQSSDDNGNNDNNDQN
ncbi:MAG TPA: PBP1A family penicillin-binding protein [Rhizomicrobium sp.]|jgi:penicillin-binding protein 1A